MTQYEHHFFSFLSIMALRVFLLGQSPVQCELSHRKQLVLRVNSSHLPLSSLALEVLFNHSLEELELFGPLSPPLLAWLPFDNGFGLEKSPLLYSTKDTTTTKVMARFGHHNILAHVVQLYGLSMKLNNPSVILGISSMSVENSLMYS